MKARRWAWALVPVLTFGLFSWLTYGFLAARRRSIPLAAEAAAYFALFLLVMSPVAQTDDGKLTDAAGILMCIGWGVSSFRAFWLTNSKRASQDSHGLSIPMNPRDTPPTGQVSASASGGDLATRDALLTEVRFGAARFHYAPPDHRIDSDIWDGLERIVGYSWTVLATAREKGIVGDQLIAVELMHSDYVPSSVRVVTAVTPEQLVTAEDAARANQTARQIVDTISRELTSMMRSVGSGDLTKLDEQQAFLQSRFGQTGSIHL
ncbi:hypothetical protein [Modestobacter sp. I12A-02662]|uniref:hypothetical protein n=1 Tax=Modestobacter sp. I12A-02662 TaxID=1730496 RepID=UPI0034DFEE2B